MSVQNRDRLHTQDEAAHPGPAEGPEQDTAADYAAVRVHVTNPVATTTDDIQYGSYATIIIPASVAGIPSWAQLLPHDPLRQYAYIYAVDYPIVIATTLAEVQSAANVSGTFPNGGYLGSGWSPPIRHNEAVYAANSSTAGPCRVVVLAETGRPQ